MYKPFSQCSLADLAHEIELTAGANPHVALDTCICTAIAPFFRDTQRSEAVLVRHPLVRSGSVLVCTSSAESKAAWRLMLRDLLSAVPDLPDASILRIYLVVKECAKADRVRVPACLPAVHLEPHASSQPIAPAPSPVIQTFHADAAAAAAIGVTTTTTATAAAAGIGCIDGGGAVAGAPVTASSFTEPAATSKKGVAQCRFKSACGNASCRYHHFSPASNFEKPVEMSDNVFRSTPCRKGLNCTKAGILLQFAFHV